MYYVERYLADVPNKTSTDLAIGAIFDESPETLNLFTDALESYRAIPEASKLAQFDPDILQLLESPAQTLDVDAVRDTLGLFSTLYALALGPPRAPSDLVAVNTSWPGSMEQDPTGGGRQLGPDPLYSVNLAGGTTRSTRAGSSSTDGRTLRRPASHRISSPPWVRTRSLSRIS